MKINSEFHPYRESYLELLKLGSHFHAVQFQNVLYTTHEKLGSESFIIHYLAPFISFVGLSWENEDISVATEHFCSDQIIRFIHRMNLNTHRAQGTPKVLLTTIPNESHSIGIAMAESILSLNGAECLSLSSETPHDEIVKTAILSKANIVGLSFSGHIDSNKEEESLLNIRKSLPKEIDLWVGGSPNADRINEIRYLHLEDIKDELNEWRLKNIYSN